VFIGNVQIQGHLNVTGGIDGPALAGTRDGAGRGAAVTDGRAALAEEEAVALVGEGTLPAGRAEVRFDPAFTAALHEGRYHCLSLSTTTTRRST